MAFHVPYRGRTPVRRTTEAAAYICVAWAAALILVTTGMVLLPRASADDIYRWRDAEGVLHFADRPPASGEADLISPTPVQDASPAAADLPPSKPPLARPAGVFWQIDNGRSPPSFLLGTIHSSDPRVLQWSDTVDETLQQARCFVMEMTLEADSFFTLGGAMLFTDGHDMADLLGEADYRRLQAAMADQPFPETILRKMKPWVLMAILSQPSRASGEFMDMRLYRMALAAGKPVFGLETADEQLAVFDGMPLADQVALLRSTLHQVEDLPRMTAQMVDTYREGHLDAIAALAASFVMKDGRSLEKRFMQRLNDERNHRMVERMLPRIEQGGAFIAVGALHLAGPTGIVRQLSDRGFRMTPVRRSEQEETVSMGM